MVTFFFIFLFFFHPNPTPLINNGLINEFLCGFMFFQNCHTPAAQCIETFFFFFLDSAGCAFVSCEHLCLTYFSLLLCGCFLQNLIFILFYFFFCLYYFQKWRCIHNVCWLCTNQERNVISHYPINNTWENNYDRSEFQTGQMTSTDLRRWHIWFC